jgi:hypothetical protein
MVSTKAGAKFTCADVVRHGCCLCSLAARARLRGCKSGYMRCGGRDLEPACGCVAAGSGSGIPKSSGSPCHYARCVCARRVREPDAETKGMQVGCGLLGLHAPHLVWRPHRALRGRRHDAVRALLRNLIVCPTVASRGMSSQPRPPSQHRLLVRASQRHRIRLGRGVVRPTGRGSRVVHGSRCSAK